MILRFLLFPFALIYGSVLAIRNFFFDVGLLPSKKFDIPVIVVGNLSVGGTGKSPHVEYLISILEDEYRVFVISRGYGRKTKGFRMVRGHSTADEVGDEPLQIKKKFPGTFIAVSESRVKGIRNMLTHNPDVFILDDAYQHRYVKPSVNILLTDWSKPFFNDMVLPAGRLREFKTGKARADIIIVTKCPGDLNDELRNAFAKKIKPGKKQLLMFSSMQYSDIVPVMNTKPLEGSLKDYKVLMLTGIANHSHLEAHLRKIAAGVDTLIFPDHHRYTGDDVRKTEEKFNNIAGKAVIVTTEKDLTRLTQWPEHLPLYVMPVRVAFGHNDKRIFEQYILDHVRENKANR